MRFAQIKGLYTFGRAIFKKIGACDGKFSSFYENIFPLSIRVLEKKKLVHVAMDKLLQ